MFYFFLSFGGFKLKVKQKSTAHPPTLRDPVCFPSIDRSLVEFNLRPQLEKSVEKEMHRAFSFRRPNQLSRKTNHQIFTRGSRYSNQIKSPGTSNYTDLYEDMPALAAEDPEDIKREQKRFQEAINRRGHLPLITKNAFGMEVMDWGEMMYLMEHPNALKVPTVPRWGDPVEIDDLVADEDFVERYKLLKPRRTFYEEEEDLF